MFDAITLRIMVTIFASIGRRREALMTHAESPRIR
jgi:hypothetical protein